MNLRQADHAALPKPIHDENARQDFVASFRGHLSRVVGAGNYTTFKTRAEPAYVKKHGRVPVNSDEVREVMTRDPYYQMWSLMQRTSQEMLWDSVSDTVERYLPELRRAAGKALPLGSLRLKNELEIPRYHTVYDIHLQPGGYHTDFDMNDVAAGAIYDLGVPIYGIGMLGPENNSTGQTIVNYYQNTYPDRRPLRILDIGCAIGNSTVPWAQVFPGAEVHGIDVGAPCLRYGHVRANALEIPIHLSQQNAEHTDFADNTFDVIASAFLFHETSRQALPAILKETYRILKPGGVAMHFDGFRTKAKRREPVLEFLGEWEIYNNNEYFLKTMHSLDMIAEAEAAGCAKGKARIDYTPFVKYERITTPGTKGYMTGFGEVPLLVTEK